MAQAQDSIRTMDIFSQSDFKQAEGLEMVAVHGTYVMIDGRKAPQDDSIPPAFLICAIALKDGARVILGGTWGENRSRSASEIANHKGREVVATGYFMRQCPGPSDGRAYIQAPCLFIVTGVWDPELYRFMQDGMPEYKLSAPGEK